MKIGKYQPFFLPVIVMASAFLSLVFILPNEIKTVKKNFKQVASEEKSIRELKEKYVLVSALDKETLNRQAISAVLALPEDKNVPYVLQALRNALESSGFSIQNLEFSPGEVKKPEEETEKTGKTEKTKRVLEELPLKVTAAGTFTGLANFFKALENTFPLFAIKELKLIKSKSGFSDKMEVSVVTFYSPKRVFDSRNITLDDLILSEEEKAISEKLPQYSITAVEKKYGGEVRSADKTPFEPVD